ncbi:glycosyl hydrolase 115 family protein [Modestobacter sp. SYSU DS0657]
MSSTALRLRPPSRRGAGQPGRWRRTPHRALLVGLALALTVPAGATSASAAPLPAGAPGGQSATAPTDPGAYLAYAGGPGRFPLAVPGRAATLVVDPGEFEGVQRAVGDLAEDIAQVTGQTPKVVTGAVPAEREVVIVGTIGHSPLVDSLVAAGKVDVSGIAGEWETSLQQVVEDPMPGVEQALVIAGSDQRGTIYGAYDVSRGIGVSPWQFWNDVVPRHRETVYVLPGRHTQGTPDVKYRGFFINDENPQLGRWAPRFFGPGKAEGFPNGFNAEFYGQVFETMLRLKANYLWPAVWGRAFAEDDPANHETASRYGVVMGTSHEAPMMRGIEEWNRHAVPAQRDAAGNIVEPGSDPYGGTGEWSFRRNRAAIEAYWREGIQRMVDQGFEGVVTIGMRGNGDVALPDGEGIDLMQEIIATQRRIIEEVTGKPADQTPQVWTLYKEVQRYWDEGLRAPEDVTVIMTDDNWGNMRKLPQPSDARPGGFGLYYHFDYVGDGRNYKWVDTTPLPNLWEQLEQSASAGISDLWVTNVGDLKGNEVPTQFFLDYAWDTQRWGLDQLHEWERRFAAENFGPTFAEDIAEVLHQYGVLQSRRKPELLNRAISLDETKDLRTDPSAVLYDDEGNPFSLTAYREMDRVTADWQELAAQADRLSKRVLPAQRDTFFQLVGYPVQATANVYELRNAQFTNLLYAEQGRAATNRLADEAEAHFAEDQAMADRYNTEIADGKWEGFQTQPHIGYGDVERYGPNAGWQQPEENHEALPDEIYPALQRIEVPAVAEMGVAIEGSEQSWPASSAPAVLPVYSRYAGTPAPYVEVFNKGTQAFEYTITPGVPWVHLDKPRGRVTDQVRAELIVEWGRAPQGRTEVPLTITGPDGAQVVVTAVIEKPDVRGAQGFVEGGGYVSMNAEHYSRAVETNGVTWTTIPDIGRDSDGVKPYPLRTPRQTPGGDSPHLAYEMHLTTTGPVDVTAYLSPRNDVLPPEGLQYAISIDDAPPQVVDIIAETGANDTTMNRQWQRNTSDNVNRTTTQHVIETPGHHVLKFWMVDPTVVLQKLVVDTGGELPSYLGPPESLWASKGRIAPR